MCYRSLPRELKFDRMRCWVKTGRTQYVLVETPHCDVSTLFCFVYNALGAYIEFHQVGSSCNHFANQAKMVACQRMRLP